MRPRGYQRRFQTITTVADTTTVLNTYYKPDLIIDGTAVMQVYDLGDATTYLPGKTHFIFYNTTPEFVGIKNSDGTVWHRLPPRAHCICALKSGLTAAGVWQSSVWDPAVGNPAYGLNVLNDFLGPITGNNQYSEHGLTGVVSGAGSGITQGTPSNGYRQGTVIVSTGTTTAGYALQYSSNGTSGFVGSGCRAFEGSMAISAISAVAEEYIFRFGIGDNIAGGAHTEGGHFLYDRLNIGTTLQLRSVKTAGGAGNTNTNTGVAPTFGATGAEWQRMRGEISSSGARLDGWLDNVLISPAGGQANLPATTTALKIINIGITKSAGNTARFIKADYLRIQSYPTVLR